MNKYIYILNLFNLFLHTCYIYVCFQLVTFVREHVWHKAFEWGTQWDLNSLLFSEFKSHWVAYLKGLVSHMFSDESSKLETYIEHVCKNKINKFKKYKSLRGPSFFKIYPYSFFGPTTTIFKYICQFISLFIC